MIQKKARARTIIGLDGADALMVKDNINSNSKNLTKKEEPKTDSTDDKDLSKIENLKLKFRIRFQYQVIYWSQRIILEIFLWKLNILENPNNLHKIR